MSAGQGPEEADSKSAAKRPLAGAAVKSKSKNDHPLAHQEVEVEEKDPHTDGAKRGAVH